MLVEDDPFWIENLEQDLSKEADMKLVAVVSTREEAVRSAQTLAIDVVLMDIQLTAHGTDGLAAARDIARTATCKIVMLSSFAEREFILESFRFGAINFISKDSYRDIVEAIRAAHRSCSGIHPSSAQTVLRELRLRHLSAAERTIYEMKEQGYSRSEIARRLHRSVETIKSQLKSISRKMNG